MDDRKLNFEENFLSVKIASGQALFPPLFTKKSISKSTPETKKMRNKTFKCSKLLLFSKKLRLTW